MKKTLRRLADGHGFLSVLLNMRRLIDGFQPIFLDYKVHPIPRYGYGKPPHPGLECILGRKNDEYRGRLIEFLSFSDELLRIPLREAATSPEPCWINEWLDGLDTFALYGFIATRNATMILEVGSGYSTKVARRAIRDQGLRTKIVSVDPDPRAEIDSLCDEVLRQPLEAIDLVVVDRLEKGDIFFMDGSHRSFMNSDVTVFFLEILPRLKPGVLVHIHDIFLPLDYKPWWLERAYPHRYWSEQYLLAATLLAGHGGYEVVLPNHHISITPQLASALDEFWRAPQLAEVPRGGSSFWIETCEGPTRAEVEC